ncbi:MAG: hypothetical protein ACI4JB_07815 [Porcipelethomonas sp.]
MTKTLKKLIAGISTAAIIAANVLSAVPASGIYQESVLPELERDSVLLDDKGMLKGDDPLGLDREYKIYYNGELMRAIPNYYCFEFVLSGDVNYEDVNDRVIEIFKEYFPENNLDDTYEDKIKPDYDPGAYISSYTLSGATIYRVGISKCLLEPDDEAVQAGREASKAVMQKLNDENLISAFYDIGQVYSVEVFSHTVFEYSSDLDPETANALLAEKGLKFRIEDYTDEDDDLISYRMVSDEEAGFEEYFSAAADIYEATGVRPGIWYIDEMTTEMVGKNALEAEPEITTTSPVTTSPETTSTTVSITVSDPEQEQTEEYTVRDAAFIAQKLAQGKAEELPDSADFNCDGVINVRDAAAIAKFLATGKK